LPLGEGVKAVDQARIGADKKAPALDLRSGPLESQQFDFGLLAIARTANDADEFIQVRQGAEVAFENLGAFLGLLQLKARPAQNHFAPMLDIELYKLLQVERLGPAVIDGQAIHGEADFQLGMLELPGHRSRPAQDAQPEGAYPV